MSAMEPFYSSMGIAIYMLSKEELYILEAELFAVICEELKHVFREQYKNYFRILKFDTEKEDIMLEVNFIRLILKDILHSEEYTLSGIAYYVDTHEDIIHELYSGCNVNPSAKLMRRIIDLHRSIRRDLYSAILKKVITQYKVNEDYEK